MNLKELLSIAEKSKELPPPETWGHGRTVFGGLIAALLVRHAQGLVLEKDKNLKSTSVTFIGPVISGENAEIRSRILRSTKSSSIIEVQLVQNSEIQTTMTVCFGIPRVSKIKVDHKFDDLNLKPRAQLNLIPYIPSLLPWRSSV